MSHDLSPGSLRRENRRLRQRLDDAERSVREMTLYIETISARIPTFEPLPLRRESDLRREAAAFLRGRAKRWGGLLAEELAAFAQQLEDDAAADEDRRMRRRGPRLVARMGDWLEVNGPAAAAEAIAKLGDELEDMDEHREMPLLQALPDRTPG